MEVTKVRRWRYVVLDIAFLAYITFITYVTYITRSGSEPGVAPLR
jgi:hypothetical protein